MTIRSRFRNTLFLMVLVFGTRPVAGMEITPLSWGLNVGDTFRLVMITNGTTAATSQNITSYDTFVNTQNLNLITYDSSSLTWQAIGTTLSSYASTDVSRYSSQANSARTYSLDGTRISNTGSFWAFSHLAPINKSVDGSGNLVTVSDFSYAWTGFDIDGQPVSRDNYDDFGSPNGTVQSALGVTATYNGYDFGNSVVLPNQILGVGYGRAGASANGWAAAGEQTQLITEYRMYAISQLITVTAVPEPSSVILGVAGISLLFVTDRYRRKRGHSSISRLAS